MGQYFIISGPERDHPLSLTLRVAAEAEGWKVTDLSRRCWLAVTGPSTPKILAVGSWTLVGDVFHRDRPDLTRIANDDPDAYERKLLARFWGRFVGAAFNADGQVSALLRDPSGALDCVTWTQDDLTVVASDIAEWWLRELKPSWSIDYHRLAQALRDPLMTSGPLPLVGPVSVAPGARLSLPAVTEARSLWSPAQIIARPGERVPLQSAIERVRCGVDEAVRGLTSITSTLASEVSGGLDSSIIASSLVGQQLGPVRLWLNAHGETRESDERHYVAALAKTLGISPTSVPLASGPVTEGLLEAISGDWRPGLNGLDVRHDIDWADRVRHAGGAAIMTGKGGDSIFVQGATTDVFSDLWVDRGIGALLSKDLRPLAMLNETSIWTMIKEARRFEREGSRPPLRDTGMLAPSSIAPEAHPWLRDLARCGPAKRLQVAGVIDNISRHAPSLQTRSIDVLNPLCALPVVEACLSLPAPTLTTGGRDRGLARLAFADRLPEDILRRRSKGNLTRLYGRLVLDSLDVLRPWLLDGRLAATGIIDRAAADVILTRESLMWRGHYAEIMVAAAFEGWVRVWEARLAPAA